MTGTRLGRALPRFKLGRTKRDDGAADDALGEAWKTVISDLQRVTFNQEEDEHDDASWTFQEFHEVIAYKEAMAKARRMMRLRQGLAGVLTALRQLGLDGDAGGSPDAAVAAMREALRSGAAVVDVCQELLDSAIEVAPKISRKGFLQALTERIPRPPDESILDWRQSAPQLYVESFRKEQRFALLDGATIEKKLEEQGLLPVQTWVRDVGGNMVCELVQEGMPLEHAERYVALAGNTGQVAIARSLAEDSPRHAACLYALVDVLSQHAHEQEHARFSKEDGGELPPPLFASLAMLVKTDKAWADLYQPDSTGFHGVLTTSVVQGMTAAACLSEKGLHITVNGNQWKEYDGDIVCFESAVVDMSGNHEAIMVGRERGAFLPNTLFSVKSKSGNSFTAGGIKVRQRLITVRPTYRLPHRQSFAGDDAKMCARPLTLQYSSRDSYVRGWDDITDKPVLTMAQEFSRDISWVDWKGTQYTLGEVWGYVVGPAVRKEDCTPGVRDDKNGGKKPEDFLAEANKMIKVGRKAGFGTDVPEGLAFLTLDEVLAVRLYSGPTYQPLNEFLRQIAQTSGKFRTSLARHPGLTFTATVGHICNAIRKLAAVANPAAHGSTLYRGVRGTLAREFWVPDEQGMVCATDVAFMSTSQRRQTPIEYMGSGPNVLWELRTMPQTDDGYHRGADISVLSQFSAEAEVLFPPMTMLEVVRAPGKDTAYPIGRPRISSYVSVAGVDPQVGRFPSMLPNTASECYNVAERLEHGKSFIAIEVQPNFV